LFIVIGVNGVGIILQLKTSDEPIYTVSNVLPR
jgi:hypothetical protein